MTAALAEVLRALDALAYQAPPPEAALSVLDDLFRDLEAAPLGVQGFVELGVALPEGVARLDWLAFALVATPLGELVRAGTPRPFTRAPGQSLGALLEATAALGTEHLMKNAFRREELVRKLLEAIGCPIPGETATQSKERLDRLDYRRVERALKQQDEERKRIAGEWAARQAAAQQSAPSYE